MATNSKRYKIPANLLQSEEVSDAIEQFDKERRSETRGIVILYLQRDGDCGYMAGGMSLIETVGLIAMANGMILGSDFNEEYPDDDEG